MLTNIQLMANDFTEQEKKERVVLIRLMKILKPKHFTLSEVGSYEVWDFFISYGGDKRYLGEIKCRNFKSTTHDCILLEEKKAKNLIYESYKSGIDKAPLYLSHYEDNIVLVLPLAPSLLVNYPPVWRKIGGISKLIHLIPSTEAKILHL